MKTSEVLRRALRSLGPNGERWGQGYAPLRPGTLCAGEAIFAAVGQWGAECDRATDAVHHNIVTFNDHSTWPQVESAFKQAIATAERGEG